MGKSKPKPKPAPVAAPIATPTEADTAQVKRSNQLDEAKRKKRQQTVFSGGGDFGTNNVLG
jgi:hypothetical protein